MTYCVSVPPIWNLGYCLVGGYQIIQLIVKNEGGDGRFCIMPKSSWPAVSFKVISFFFTIKHIRNTGK